MIASTNAVLVRVIIGALAASGIGFAGYRARALSWSGAIAAGVMGTAAVAAGWTWAAVLLAYFGVSTWLSKLGWRRRRARLAGMVDKTGARDATQVMANGFPLLLCALIPLTRPSSELFLWTVGGAGSLAASAADTWATEIGTLVGQPPRSILTWRRMNVGESGGVTWAGWIAAVGGAAFVASIASLVWHDFFAFPFILLGGLAGAAVDSIVGTSVQRRSWCDVCGRSTEMRIHDCGTPSRHIGGLAWLENDGVNLIATLTVDLLPPLIAYALLPSHA